MPEEVVVASYLSHEQKIDILERWKYDAVELETAEEENMGRSDVDLLDAVMVALHQLQD